MNKQTWLDVKENQIKLYKERAKFHKKRRNLLFFLYLILILCSVIIPWSMFTQGLFLIGLSFFILIPVSMLIWKLYTYENRSLQLLSQLATLVGGAIAEVDLPLESLKQNATELETRFLSNDDELFLKKAIWDNFLDYKRKKRDEEIRYERAVAEYNRGPKNGFKPTKNIIFVPRLTIGAVWNTEVPHRGGYKDSNTIEDEWAIIKAFRRLIFASYTETHGILEATSKLAKRNPVVFERYLRKKKISKKMKRFKRLAGVHYLSPAAKMRLVTFVEEVLALEPTVLNENTVTLLHEKNEQIKKYTEEFWDVHNRSIKFYWFEALWLLLIIPFIVGAGSLISSGHMIEAVIVFTLGASLVAFGEMALVVRQKIKLNGKKLIPPLIASLIGSRYSMGADTECAVGIDNYRRRFKNLEKHFIMTTSEIDSVKYVKDNLRDEEGISKTNKGSESVCTNAEKRMESYYKMFHLYRGKCLQYGCLELFLGIMLVPIWGLVFISAAYFGYLMIDLFFPVMLTITVFIFELIALNRHIRVWRFKELYFKIYQGLSVIIIDGELRLEPEKLNNMFEDIENSALKAICRDDHMRLMANTLSRVSGLPIPENTKRHELDEKIRRIRAARLAENRRNGKWF